MTFYDVTVLVNMADMNNKAVEVDEGENKPSGKDVIRGSDNQKKPSADGGTTAEYCEKLQTWMWQYYAGYVNWQSWLAASAVSCPYLQPPSGTPTAGDWHAGPLGLPLLPYPPAVSRAGEAPVGAAAQQHQPPPQANGNAQRPGREYSIPSPLQRLMAEMVDFFILFFIKASIIISIMHLSGIKDVSKFAMHLIVEEIDEDTSMEELQKMMLVALVYRILVCFYEIVCIWGAGGATPGKFLLGLRVVTCDSSVLVQPNRVLVVPATNVSLSASTVRALNKNFSIAFFFPAFITLLFFQHNRTVYDMVAGTIVVKRSRAR
ncbi:protein FAM8A1 [Nothobranchius furzeri]|uniref:Family with sequence similarity 8 member A1 n=4 Tax=Nothobranchius TaxID=28779 RepID=A0A1A7ZM69_NOTFU|nr:protein FAM8A1 [Nothobranchius furzeri]KAF7227357.1 protein FAM8A1-like [Nothobranchius furzeri]